MALLLALSLMLSGAVLIAACLICLGCRAMRPLSRDDFDLGDL